MKRGKSVKLNTYAPIKTIYGTVDSKNLKSIFINIQSWVEPKQDSESWVRVVNNLRRQIYYSVSRNVNYKLFSQNFIVDLDLRTSGVLLGKKSFFNLEINLYTNHQLDFKSTDVKDMVKKIIKAVYTENIMDNNYFQFTRTKDEYINNP
jgi:hypothetical protein